MKHAQTTATVTISCYWDRNGKGWLLVARDALGRQLASEKVSAPVALDRPGTALVLRAVRADLEARLA